MSLLPLYATLRLFVLLVNTPCSYKHSTQCDPVSRVTDTANFQPWKHQLRGSQLDNVWPWT